MISDVSVPYNTVWLNVGFLTKTKMIFLFYSFKCVTIYEKATKSYIIISKRV